jgi:hypothetical protein
MLRFLITVSERAIKRAQKVRHHIDYRGRERVNIDIGDFDVKTDKEVFLTRTCLAFLHRTRIGSSSSSHSLPSLCVAQE